ncbi:MAG: recombinase family protein [Candidatus Dormibacteria bacterium]
MVRSTGESPLGYARVSTIDQNPDLQLDALKEAGCYRIFVDKASGALDERREPTRVRDQLRPGDTLVVWKLDRLGRSLRHLIDTVGDLERQGIAFRSLRESIDTATPSGKLIFHIFGALAEFERDLIRERTVAGLAAVRARGRSGGRPPMMTFATEYLRAGGEIERLRRIRGHTTYLMVMRYVHLDRGDLGRDFELRAPRDPSPAPGTKGRPDWH